MLQPADDFKYGRGKFNFNVGNGVFTANVNSLRDIEYFMLLLQGNERWGKR
jgi:hypothetical protein